MSVFMFCITVSLCVFQAVVVSAFVRGGVAERRVSMDDLCLGLDGGSLLGGPCLSPLLSAALTPLSNLGDNLADPLSNDDWSLKFGQFLFSIISLNYHVCILLFHPVPSLSFFATFCVTLSLFLRQTA